MPVSKHRRNGKQRLRSYAGRLGNSSAPPGKRGPFDLPTLVDDGTWGTALINGMPVDAPTDVNLHVYQDEAWVEIDTYGHNPAYGDLEAGDPGFELWEQIVDEFPPLWSGLSPVFRTVGTEDAIAQALQWAEDTLISRQITGFNGPDVEFHNDVHDFLGFRKSVGKKPAGYTVTFPPKIDA